MTVRVGTSGFAYKEWKGSFYPEDLKNADMLRFYAERFASVEINNTFYRMPSVSVLEGWRAQVPDTFQFVLKASQRITHRKRLKDAGDEMDYWVATAGTLGTQLGPTLVQLPPNLKVDVPRLEGFLDQVPRGFRCAFEFRHPSWAAEPAVRAALEAAGAAWVIADADEDDLLRVERTAPFVYARLRRVAYTDADVGEWARRLVALDAEDLYVFFKHEDEGTGPALAARFLEHVEAAR
ncbi:MAG: DUF72 domain-containing protein [Gemmatimonadota bacterium]|nr:DUF72 domain-containing protein [Gemmatimonadota bacterium]